MWQSERLDHDSGLVYMNARFYDPELGRFASADSIIPDPYRPQSLDRYAYVENDPANYTDPSGHMKMQVEQRKEAAMEASWGAMYQRSLTAGCGPWSVQQCVTITSSTIITEKYGQPETRSFSNQGSCVGGDTCRSSWAKNKEAELTPPPLVSAPDDAGSDRSSWEQGAGSDPSEWAQWPGDPSEWAQWPGDPSEWAQWPGKSPREAAPARRSRELRRMGLSSAPHSARLIDQELELDLSGLSSPPKHTGEPTQPHASSGVDHGRGILELAAPLGLLKIGAVNIFAQIGATIGETMFGYVRIVAFATDYDLGELQMQTMWGRVQEGLNKAYEHEWDTMSGNHH